MIARTLGRFNGAFLVGMPIPSAPWLAPSWLRVHVEARATMVAMLAAQRNHALVRQVWPAANIAGVLRLWEERQVLLAALDRLPQAFVHRDATLRNLLLHTGRPETTVTAIDWGLAGPGVVGEDAGSLLLGQLTLGDGVAAAAGELDRTIFDAYLDGLSLAGWQGTAQRARLGYTASVALRASLGFVANNVPLLLTTTHEHLEAICRADHGRSLDEMAAITAARIAVALRLGDEACQVADDLR